MAKQIGLDLGTANTAIYQKGKGIILHEPTVIGMERVTRKILASGNEAKEMLGKTPAGIRVLRPLKNGIVTDYSVATLLIRNDLRKIRKKLGIRRPNCLVSIPLDATDVERRALEEAVMEAGAKSVKLIGAPIAGAVGAGMEIFRDKCTMIVNISAGLTEAAILKNGKVAEFRTVRLGGEAIDQAVIAYLKEKRGILIGENTAEELKCRIGSATSDYSTGSMEIVGRNLHDGVLREGLPVVATVKAQELQKAIREPVDKIVATVKEVLTEAPKEHAADIYDTGIVLIGGAAKLPGLADLIRKHTHARVVIADRESDCVALGLCKIPESREKQPSVFQPAN